MNDKEFLIKYEELLNKDYCNCNEMNCIDNNSPRRILNIAKNQQKEIERLNNIINELKYGIKELDNMFYETFRISQNGYFSISEWELKEFTNKLKELKEKK